MKKNTCGIVAVVLLLIPSLAYLVQNILNATIINNLDSDDRITFWSIVGIVNVIMNIVTIVGYILLGIHFIKSK